MNDKQTIQGLWVGSTLPTMQRLSISSFLAHGHNYHLYAYADLTEVPEGAELKDASEILPTSAAVLNSTHNTFASPFSDKFRYRLLLEKGGWWADTDVICLRPFDFPSEYVFSAEHRIPHGAVREVATITVMKAARGAKFLEVLYDSCVKLGTVDLEWNESGSTLLGSKIDEFSLHASIQRAVTFCPIPMNLYDTVLDPNLQFIFEPATYGVHLWHELWRRNGLNTDNSFPASSLYEQFKAVFLNKSGTSTSLPFIVEQYCTHSVVEY
jgi:hypothetical protein